MQLFGTLLVLGAGGLALLTVSSYGAALRGRPAATTIGRLGVSATLGAVALLWLSLVALFLARRFDVAYVNSYSSLDLAPWFALAASWAGQPGSFLIWALLAALGAPLLARQARDWEAPVMSVYMALLFVLLLFVLLLTPFAPTVDPLTGARIMPSDGAGLNPLLHNPWMIVHPPVLFAGYALAAAPFAFAVAALLRRDSERWVHLALPWTLAAWTVLGLALLLGGYWAYETLGWGGYWGWDPVENSALVPWLVLTALLHGMIVQRRSGVLRRTNLSLALLLYPLIIYATFLTRSGVYANFSVHSFVAEGLFGWLAGYLVLLSTAALGLLVWRWRCVASQQISEQVMARESFVSLALVAWLALAGLVAVGTSMPLISALPGVGHGLQRLVGTVFAVDDGSLLGNQPLADGRFSLLPAFYQTTTPPLGLVILVLMSVGPLLGWRDSNLRHLLRMLRLPFLVALLAGAAALALGVSAPLALAYVTLAVFALLTNGIMVVRTIRGGWLRIGGYLAHVGATVFLIGVVASTVYATPETQIVVAQGEPVGVYGYDIGFDGWREIAGARGVLDLALQRGDQEIAAQAQFYVHQPSNAIMKTPAIVSSLWRDLYITPVDYLPADDPARPVLGLHDVVEIGPYTVEFREFSGDPAALTDGVPAEVGAHLLVEYEGRAYSYTPLLRQTAAGTLARVPLVLPGGQQLELVTVDPLRQMVWLAVDGLDLPVRPAQAVLTVSSKPLVGWVWGGVLLMLGGGGLALIRRAVEGNARLAGVAVRLPWGPGRRRQGAHGPEGLSVRDPLV